MMTDSFTKILISNYGDSFAIIGLYLITLSGSTVMYVFSLVKDFHGSIRFLKRVFPGKKQVFYDRVDFIIVIFIGSIIGFIFYNPQTALQALLAGMGWISALNIILNRANNRES